MKILYLTAGASGMYCGSCLRDNRLVQALRQLGHEATLVPLYTPIRTDEEDLSEPLVFYGGVNVYLQDRFPWLKKLPPQIDQWLNHPTLLRILIRDPGKTRPETHARLALSLLKGDDGPQVKELNRLLDWLRQQGRPHVINLTNLLIAGCVPKIKKVLDLPIVVTLQGDDLFLDSLPTQQRKEVIHRLQDLVPKIDRFIVYSNFYAEKMAKLLRIPRDRLSKVPLGIDPEASSPPTRQPRPAPAPGPPTIGYFARVSPHKGLHLLVDAFLQLRQHSAWEDCRLHVAGWAGKEDQRYLQSQKEKLRQHGALEHFHYAGSPDGQGKRRFLEQLTVFSVPSLFEETKGLSILEAMAAGVPCVQPASGIFPEMFATIPGGLLFTPNDARDLATQLARILKEDALRDTLREKGREGIRRHAQAHHMAHATAQVYASLP